jgi:hypothetical protein
MVRQLNAVNNWVDSLFNRIHTVVVVQQPLIQSVVDNARQELDQVSAFYGNFSNWLQRYATNYNTTNDTAYHNVVRQMNNQHARIASLFQIMQQVYQQLHQQAAAATQQYVASPGQVAAAAAGVAAAAANAAAGPKKQ